MTPLSAFDLGISLGCGATASVANFAWSGGTGSTWIIPWIWQLTEARSGVWVWAPDQI